MTPSTLSEVDQPIQVAIAVVERAGSFLVGVRPDGVALAGFAEFPGGKALPGETPSQAAVRECREETGLEVEVVARYFSTVYRYDHGLLELHFFQCRLSDRDRASPPPHPPFRWIGAHDLAALPFPAANTPLTELLLDRAGIANRGENAAGTPPKSL